MQPKRLRTAAVSGVLVLTFLLSACDRSGGVKVQPPPLEPLSSATQTSSTAAAGPGSATSPPPTAQPLLASRLLNAIPGQAQSRADVASSPKSNDSSGNSNFTEEDTRTGVSTSETTGDRSRNLVRLVNKVDGRFRFKGRIQLNHIPGSTASPENLAYSYASCTDCQTMTVALQINLISKTATTITPQNAAVALNYKCTRCDTYAIAYQYNLQVDDPNQTPDNVDRLVKQMDKELNAIHSDHSTTLPQAIQKVNEVIAQYQALTASLTQQQKETTENDSPDAKPITIATPTPPAGAASAPASSTPTPPQTAVPSSGPTSTSTPKPASS